MSRYRRFPPDERVPFEPPPEDLGAGFVAEGGGVLRGGDERTDDGAGDGVRDPVLGGGATADFFVVRFSSITPDRRLPW